MSTIVLSDAYVEVGAAGDISDNVKTVTLNYSAELLDDTAMGDTTKSRKGGLKDWSVDLDCYTDFADDALDEDLFALVGSTVAVKIRPTSAVKSATNPSYEGTGILESFPMISGTVGEMAMTKIKILAAGPLSREV